MENMERSMEELKLMMLELEGIDQLRKEKQTMEVSPVSQTHADSNSSLNDNGGGMLQQLTQNSSFVVSQLRSHLVTSAPNSSITKITAPHTSLSPVMSPLQARFLHYTATHQTPPNPPSTSKFQPKFCPVLPTHPTSCHSDPWKSIHATPLYPQHISKHTTILPEQPFSLLTRPKHTLQSSK